MKSLQEYLRLADKEGTTRSGIILGIRMALLGLKKLGIQDLRQHDRALVAIVETDRCLPDAVELVTECRLGNRTLKLRDMGKMAATFVDLSTDRAVRVAAKENANRRALELFPSMEKEAALEEAYRQFADEELFAWQLGYVKLAREDVPGYRNPRVVCDGCGESIAFGRQIVQGQRTLCQSCAGDRYFEPS